MSFFDNGEPEKFLLFICNFNMTLAASGTLEAGARYQYLRNIVCREVFHQFEFLSADGESAESLSVDYIIRDLSHYFPPVSLLSKQKRAMRRGMKNAQPNCKTLCGAFD